MTTVTAKGVIARTIDGITIAGIALLAASPATNAALHAQAPRQSAPPSVHLPDEAGGLDAIARALVSAFDHVDIVALGEAHGNFAVDAGLRLALLHNADFVKRVRFIVIECASVTEQATLDRYIRGESVAKAQLERVWKSTNETTNGFCDQPEYPCFLAAIRDINSRQPASARIRVLGGHPGPSANRGIENTAVSVLKEQVIRQHGKALLVFGAAHFYRTLPAAMLSSMGDDTGMASKLESEFPGRTFVVIPIGPLDARPGNSDRAPDFHKFDGALKTQSRPVLISLQRPPFRDFTAEEFLGRTVTSCSRGGGCASAFKGSAITLGQIADACVYVGARAERMKQARADYLTRTPSIMKPPSS